MINKTFRLFISSTFNDFIEERNILNDVIFTTIDDFCQSKGYNFQIIDLRWGVNNESALNQNTLAICLDEVKRCRTLSPKPNFLILAGERYGWIPLPAKITAMDFKELMATAQDCDRALISEWYLLDENELEGEYYLKIRSREYVNDANWQVKEKELYEALLRCVSSKPNISTEYVNRLTSSATEQEILEGLLEGDGVSNNTIAIFRSNYHTKDADQSKIIKLKNRIIDKMKSDGCDENILHLEWDGELVHKDKGDEWESSPAYKSKFTEITIETLKKNIEQEILRLEKEAEEMQDETLDQIRETAAILFERDTEIQHLTEYIEGVSNKTLFLFGESGCGKTTLLSELIKKTKDPVFYVFYGWNEESYTLLSSLDFVIQRIKKHFNITKNLNINETNISEVFYQAIYSIPKDNKAIIIIDGMDMFHDIDSIKESVFPSALPDNVKIIVSSANIEIIERFADANHNYYELARFGAEESQQCFSALMHNRNRCIASESQEKLVHTVIGTGVTPLQLKLLVEECSGWHSEDEILDLPTSVEAIAQKHISNMYTKFGHNKELVLYALALIAASPYGITEEELQSLLLRFDSVKAYFTSEDRYNHQTGKLPFVVWSRLFYDLKGCLTLVRSNGHIVVKFEHQVFKRVVTHYYKAYYDKATQKLIDYYESQCNYLNTSQRPNIRKALSLSALLKQTNQIDRLKSLFLDLTYVDSVVKSGRVNEAISNLRFVLNQAQKDSNTEQLKNLFECLQSNRIMLTCYTKEFYSCYNNQIGNDNANTIYVSQKRVEQATIFFPYSLSSHIKWNSSGSKYAVFNNSYVYICDQAANEELCKIYLEPREGERVIAKDVIWLEDHLIAILTFSNTLELFDFQDGTPNPGTKLHANYESLSIGYSPVSKYIFLQEKNRIIAYNIVNGNEEYAIRLKHMYKTGFELCTETNILIVKDTIKAIRFFDASSGKQIKCQKINEKYTFDNWGDLLVGDIIHQIDDNTWTAYMTKSRRKNAIHSSTKKKSEHLHPPMFDLITNQIMGNKTLLLVYADRIILLELFGEYKMRWIATPYINDVAWVIKDETVSVLTNDGLMIIKVDDFNHFSDENERCMVLSKNLFQSFALAFKSIDVIFKNIRDLPFFKSLTQLNNVLDYKYLFSSILESVNTIDLESVKQDLSTASVIIDAADGKQAAIYEEEEVILVFDAQHKPILQIDKLKLSLIDNILKIMFSPDSKHLLIWRNDSLQIIDVFTGERKIDVDLRFRPALDIDFCDNSKITILFCNGQRYVLEINNQTTVQLPDNLVSSPHLDAYFGPYNYYYWEKEYKPFILLDLSDFDLETSPNKWFKQRRVYHGNTNWLYFKNGTFYLQGDTKQEFKHDFYDFQKSLQFEILSESKPMRMYLHEKNDLFSNLYEIDNKYLVLVTRLLNSVIVFDLDNMNVCAAHKLAGNIIGCVYDANTNMIDITIDKHPYHVEVQLNLITSN